jgi:hypothetical protein
MVSLPIFLVVPEGHIIPCPTNGLLARCNMQLSATEFCHSIAESQLYSTATLRNGNFFGYIMHWGLHRAAVQCRDSIIYQIGYPRRASQRRGANNAVRSNPQSARSSSRWGCGTAKVGSSITQFASSSIKSLTSSSFHAHYCANRAIIRLSSPYLQFLSHKLLFSNI